MADNNKAVGSLAAAKMVTLIKAETAKKYDKTGGKIEGSAEITGGLKVGMSSEFSSSIKAESEISSDMLLMAPIVALYDPAKEESISFGVSGENAAKVTSPVSGGGIQYARLKVATPTGDNDAATKAYVDSKSAVATASANGLMSAADKVKLDGVEAGANKTTVDAALDAGSANPVQNKAVKAALDSKLSTLGGEISGNLDVGLTVGAGGSVSTGVTKSDSGIHFEKAASDAGRISHGMVDVDDTVPLARLKVASPTEDDDAATKAYVDNNAAGAGAVRYDAAQTLNEAQQFQARKNIGAVGYDSPQFQGFLTLAPANAPLGIGVGLSPIGSGTGFALDISDVNEGTPTLLTGVKTPTDADTDAAANVEYVKTKISEVSASGGVDVDNALSATSTNPVQNKVITSALNGKADKSELGNKADKTALDAKADKTALDAKLDKTGGTLTGNLTGKYITGTWLQSTAAANLGKTPGKIAVLDDSGWVYYRTPSELLADIGGMPSGDYYTKAEVDAAIAVQASTSVYGTTKLSNSTTSSSKTLAATPYAVKTALAQAKAYVDSAIAVAINSAY